MRPVAIGRPAAEILADLGRVAEGADPVDALREAGDVDRGEVGGDLLLGDAAGEDHPGVARGELAQALEPGAVADDQHPQVGAVGRPQRPTSSAP